MTSDAQAYGLSLRLPKSACAGILALLALPELVLFIIAASTGQVIFGWLALGVGVVLGAVFLVIGIRMGGSRLDLRGTDLLERLTRQR